MIYMDNAATTKLSDTAIETMTELLKTNYGNPSSIHQAGQEAIKVLASARESIAKVLGAEPREIYFTSGGTESDNWAIHSAALLGAKKGRKHIISSVFEHHAVLHTLTFLEGQGFEISLLPIDDKGMVNPEDLRKEIREDTALVTIMYANNEIGSIQDIKELGAICKEKGVLFHTDAVQAVGHIEIDVKAQNIDMLSLSAHKFHGPKGIGALYCKKGILLSPFINGGAQEFGKRGGTENVPAIAAMAAALDEVIENREADEKKVIGMRDELIKAFSKIPRSLNNSGSKRQLPGIVNFCFEGIEGEAILLLLDSYGICASSGSACTSGSLDPSHVLLALGLPHEIAHGSLRVSLSKYNSMEEVNFVTEKLPEVVKRLRDMSPVWDKIERGE